MMISLRSSWTLPKHRWACGPLRVATHCFLTPALCWRQCRNSSPRVAELHLLHNPGKSTCSSQVSCSPTSCALGAAARPALTTSVLVYTYTPRCRYTLDLHADMLLHAWLKKAIRGRFCLIPAVLHDTCTPFLLYLQLAAAQRMCCTGYLETCKGRSRCNLKAKACPGAALLQIPYSMQSLSASQTYLHHPLRSEVSRASYSAGHQQSSDEQLHKQTLTLAQKQKQHKFVDSCDVQASYTQL